MGGFMSPGCHLVGKQQHSNSNEEHDSLFNISAEAQLDSKFN